MKYPTEIVHSFIYTNMQSTKNKPAIEKIDRQTNKQTNVNCQFNCQTFKKIQGFLKTAARNKLEKNQTSEVVFRP